MKRHWTWAALGAALALAACDNEDPRSQTEASSVAHSSEAATEASAQGGLAADPRIDFEAVKAAALKAASEPLQTEAVRDKTSDEAALAAGVEPMGPIERVREFTCTPGAILGTTDISDVQGVEGATLAIRPTSEPCGYHLVYRSGRAEVQLSEVPGGYLLSTGGEAPSGRAMACASNIHHVPDPSAVATADGSLPRLIERVDVECAWRRRDGSWTPLQSVLGGGEDWAAWVVEVQQSTRDPDSFRVAWMRDFSFQFLNLSNEGRPATDGVYATRFRVVDEDRLVVGGTERISDIVPEDAVTVEPWEPTTPEELRLPGVPAPIND